jgi:sugar porter (SP) family MFS transporter
MATRADADTTSTDTDAAQGAAKDRSQKFTAVVLLAAVVSSISSLLYGYDTGIISGALLQIRRDFHTGSGMEQVIAGSILFGAALGALSCSRLSERYGRRTTILALAVIFVVGALASAAAPSAWLLSAGRVVLGFAVGGATQTVPMYVAELAPARHRGKLVLTFQVGIGVGIVLSTIVGATESVSWRLSVGAATIPAALLFLVMLRLPESPRWLVKNNDRDQAREVLVRVRADGADIDGELGDIVELEDKERDTGAADRGWRGVRQHWVRPAVVVGCGVAIFTQLSGIEMIIYYAPTILTDNGFSNSAALRVSVALGATYLVMMIVGLNIVDRIGRRRLTLTMIPGTAAALGVLGTLFVTGHSGRGDVPFIIACLVVFMFFNAGGLQLMGWLTGAEIYPLGARSAGTSLQATILWSTNLLITLTVLTVIDTIGVGQTMWLYGAFNVAAWLFVWRRMPELTGLSLERIEKQLHDDRFRPADFAAVHAGTD